jgi:twitching motility protein PilT
VPGFDELGLPEQLQRLTEFNQGLVLVTGPNGCGKSTTMAAMVERVNQTRNEHIITIEDPVEFNFVPALSQINQREVGAHTKSFAAALRAALREDPDVIVIGELRDRETVSLAITAAETGHLVFGTMHTTSAARTIDRVLDVFPPDEQPQVRSMISESIRGIVCQQLIPRKDGGGRALALEVMLNSPAIANLMRERKLFQIPSIIQTSRQQGMILLDNSLLELVHTGVIDGMEAYYAADNKAPFLKWAPKIDGMAAEA